MFTDLSVPEECDKWRSTINTAVAFFSRMKDYSAAAERSRQVVSRLLDAAKLVADTTNARKRQEEAMKAVVAQRDRDVYHLQRSSKKSQHNFLGAGGPRSNSSLGTHSPSHSQSSLDQLDATNIPHPAIGLPISIPLGLGMNNMGPASQNVWHDPTSTGGIGPITPQSMPHGGAFWDEMMWENFTPVAEHPPPNPFSMDGYTDSPGSGNWSPHTNDLGNHHQGWSGYHQNQQM